MRPICIKCRVTMLHPDSRLNRAAPELLAACRMMIRWIEDGTLVRDISKDARPDWAHNMMRFTMDLNKVQMAIVAAEAKHPEPKPKERV